MNNKDEYIKGYEACWEKNVKPLAEIAVYVRDTHLCGTPLLEAIKKALPASLKDKTSIKKWGE